jgi:hypothetical protein
VRHEQRLDAGPAVADEGRAARGRFEQAHAGRPAGRDHVCARHVEREALAVVEAAVLRGRQMGLVPDVRRPARRLRILRSRDDEAPLRMAARGLQQEGVHARLAVIAVGAHVAQVPLQVLRLGEIQRGVERAVERPRPRRAELVLEPPQRRAAGEGQVQVVAGDLPRMQVLVVAAGDARQGHRRVDVVEGLDAIGLLLHPVAHAHAVGDVRADDHEIGRPHFVEIALLQFLDAAIEARGAIGRIGEITVRCVPGLVALEEQHFVPAPDQFAHQPAVGGRVAVAPGGRDRQPEDDDLHAASSAAATFWQPCSTSSSCAARCAYVCSESTRR